MAPVVHGLEVEFYGEVEFVYLDIDDPMTEELKRALGFRYQPRLFLVDGNGTILEQWVGGTSEDVLRAALLAATP